MAAITNMIYLGDISEESKTIVDPDKTSASVPYAAFNERDPVEITSLKVLVNATQDLHGYGYAWPSGGNWIKLNTNDEEPDFELGGVRNYYPVGSRWDRVKASTGEQESEFRTKELINSIATKPFTIEFNAETYNVGFCLFSEERYLGKTTGWIDYQLESPYTFIPIDLNVSEFAIVVKRKDDKPVTEDDFKNIPPVYQITTDKKPQKDKTYYTRGGYVDHFVYTEFTGETFEKDVIYYEMKEKAKAGINLKYRIGPDSNISPITGVTGILLSHSYSAASSPDTYYDNWASTIGPIYGGVRSFIDGELLVNKTIFYLTSVWIDDNPDLWEIVTVGEYKVFRFRIPAMKDEGTATRYACSHLWQATDIFTPYQDYMWRINNAEDKNIELWLTKDFKTIDDFKGWLDDQENNTQPVAFIFRQMGVSHTMEPITIPTYSGANVIWADTGDIRELVYHTSHQELVKTSSLERIYNDNITEIQMDTSVSMIGDELFIDQFVPTIWYYVKDPYIINPHDEDDEIKGFKSIDKKIFCSARNYNLRKIPYGAKVTYYTDGVNVGEFFCKNVERTGKSTYKINAMSAVGLMDRQYHVGGIYTGQPLTEVIDDILGPGYEYTVDGLVAAELVFGWLPYDTKRNNLHQLMMAFGVNIVKNANGKMHFTFLNAEGTPTEIPENRIFSGGSVKYDESASRIELTEHGYHFVANVEYETVFDNQGEDAVEHSLVTFDHPINPDTLYVAAGSFEIEDAGVNYIRISGYGAIKAQPYVHNTRILAQDNVNASDENIIKVEDATLVTMMNSENVLLRLAQYYFNATTITQDIEVIQEKAGERYAMHNAFREYSTGFISKMSTTTSSFRRASCDIIENYIPIGQGASYTNHQIIPLDTGAVEEWIIPESVFQKDKPTIRIILIGFGEDGYPGEPGEDGKKSYENTVGTGGEGGLGGEGGNGGKVYPVTLLATGLTKIKFYNENKDSVLLSGRYHYTSADGASAATGYFDPYTGVTFAKPGKAGFAGCRGGNSGYRSPKTEEIPATAGEDLTYEDVLYTGGKVGSHSKFNGSKVGISSNITIYVGEFGGGGAAVGSNGGDGHGYTEYNDWGGPGNGADGNPGDPLESASATIYGYGDGGNGGHGGGGGAGAGMSYWYNQPHDYVNAILSGDPGRGGLGGAGGKGNFGCAIIYW